MASINTIVKRKQYLWLGIVVVGAASAIGGALYLSDVDMSGIDIFFKGMNNTNYNMAVCGTSGAGKTGLIQPLIRSVLDSGGFAVVFDMGDGYKSLCENMGGVYLDGETLRFNPFANITDIDQSAERVRDQLSVMASPNGNLDEVHEGLLLQAVRASWLAKKKQARIDDVVDFLKNARDNDQYVESPTIRSRLDEMIVLLDQYTANGTYGRYFNSDEPSLRDDARMVVLELGGLEDRPSLLVAVMFSLIIYIENRMYRTPRTLKKKRWNSNCHPGSVNPVKWWIWPLMRHGNRKIIRTSSSRCSVVKR